MSDPETEDEGGGIKKELKCQIEPSQGSEITSSQNEMPTSPTGESIASDIQSVKSPDFDERELEDVQLNDRSEDLTDEGDRDVYSSLPRYTFSPSDVGQSNNIEEVTPSHSESTDQKDSDEKDDEVTTSSNANVEVIKNILLFSKL